jgi:L-serine dehydratase
MMTSIKSIYKIGRGPSSSHTMGPVYASTHFKKLYPNADEFKVILYGSLALTGKGHLTDAAIMQTLAPIRTEVIFDIKTRKIEHPNTMDFFAYHQKQLLGTLRFFSVGGGDIVIKGQTKTSQEKSVYPHRYLTDIIKYCNQKKIRLIDYIKKYEPAETWAHLKEV